MSTLSEVVYSYLFPDGMIPLACKNNLPAIDARLSEIEVLAAGKPFDGSKRAASKLLTEQVVQLRDSCSPPMTWQEIARRMGGKMTTDAVRNRYVDCKTAQKAAAMQKEGYAALSGQAIQEGRYTTPPEMQEKIDSSDHIPDATKMVEQEDQFAEPDEMVPGDPRRLRQSLSGIGGCKEDRTDIFAAAQPALLQPALLEAKPQQVEDATTRYSRIVQEKEEVPAKPKPSLKIPHSEDERIFRERESGKAIKDIAEELQKEGYKATPANVQARYYSVQTRHAREQAQPKQPEPPKEPSQPGVEGAQDTARANPRGTPEEKPESKAISRYELASKIWTLWNGGEKTPDQISEILCAEGYYYGAERVKRMLLQQCAML